jgi:Asp-tRNA(Asn)/Glu-tRNA(Gln) amidotransferase A subunit family amidase
MKYRLIACLSLGFFPAISVVQDDAESQPSNDVIRSVAAWNELGFSDEEIDLMRGDVASQLEGARTMREYPLDNSVSSALVFDPFGVGVQFRATPVQPADTTIALPDVDRPSDLEDLAFADITTLAALIRSRKVSCVEVAQNFITRLRRLDETLHCVITFTEERALEQSRVLDQELSDGKWRGLLHGIPWGAKDLLAVRGYPTTWGAMPFKDQVIDVDATVVTKLDQAGAVLIAKLSLGALAWGDVWFDGTTRNPWNREQGSSGSSAGPASATAAGGVVFAIGSETLGSIISPSVRCGNSSLRPTFGAVSRHGAMALSWSMDKLGPMCRTLHDAAIVFDAIQGPDPLDTHGQSFSFRLPERVDVRGWKVGYPAQAFENSLRDKSVLAELEKLGVELVPIDLPSYPVSEMSVILSVEAAAAFDELTRTGRAQELVRQSSDAWPNVFRSAQLVSAVQYINANRLRSVLMRDMDAVMSQVDLFVHPSFYGLTSTNLTGHPTVVAPNGFTASGMPYSICFTGQLFGEEQLLALSRAWQESNRYHEKHP